MTKVTKHVNFCYKICSDLAKQVFSTCVLSCSSANSFICIDRWRNNEEISTKQNVKIRHLAPPCGARWPMGKLPCPIEGQDDVYSLSTSSCPIAVTMWSSYRHLAPVILPQPTKTWNHLICKPHGLVKQKRVNAFELVKIIVHNRNLPISDSLLLFTKFEVESSIVQIAQSMKRTSKNSN